MAVIGSALPITSAIGGAMGVVLAGLSLRVGLTRFGSKTWYGNGGPKAAVLEHRSRAQGSFAEYGSWFLIELALLELQQSWSQQTLAIVGSSFLVARLMHVAQLANPSLNQNLRIVGFMSTLAIIAVAGAKLVSTGFSGYKSSF